jgi:thiol-disulfide isomerase/thioredoxin
VTSEAPTAPPGQATGSLRRSRRKYLAIAAVLVVVAVVAIVVASQSNPSSVSGGVDVKSLKVGPEVPALTNAKGWLNSKPLTSADLTGKVVLYDFWTYSCVNCVRSIPHLRSWYQRYAADGLVIVGVHSPEFDFEKNPSNVAAAVKRLGVDYPVALDPNMGIWNAFGNQYWPEEWVADKSGHLRYQSVGEGDYTQTENVLRELLGVKKSAPRAAAPSAGSLGAPPAQNQNITQETYLGLERGSVAQPGTTTYPPLLTVPPDEAGLVGSWDGTDQYVQSAAPGATVVLSYQARSANLVMSVAKNTPPVKVVIELDGQPVPVADRTAQTQVDAQGQTYITVSTPDLYKLVLSPGLETHTVRLIAQSPGLQAYSFTFGA